MFHFHHLDDRILNSNIASDDRFHEIRVSQSNHVELFRNHYIHLVMTLLLHRCSLYKRDRFRRIELEKRGRR